MEAPQLALDGADASGAGGRRWRAPVVARVPLPGLAVSGVSLKRALLVADTLAQTRLLSCWLPVFLSTATTHISIPIIAQLHNLH